MVSTLPYRRLLQRPTQSFFLFGMRGVGKSTWARVAFPDALRLDLLDEALYQSYLRDPTLFGQELRRVPPGRWVIVDEVQRLPALLNEVHRFIEERRLRFALLGSSARKLKQAGTNLLAGRALRRVMLPLPPEELGADFDADTHLAWLLPAYEARLRVKERKHPKLYWADPGIARAARQELRRPTERERGPLLEGWVYMLLKAYGDPGSGLGLRHDGLFYWAPAEGGTEVDFIVRRGKEAVAIDVKASRQLVSRDFRGLRAIADLGGLKRRVVVFLGDRPFVTNEGIEALPVAEFVRELETRRI